MLTLSRRLCCLVTFVALAACQPGEGAGPRRAPILNGQMMIGLPSGYCIDNAAGEERDDTAVLFLGKCFEVSSRKAALISITVGKTGSGGVMTAGGARLAAFFRSSEGRATLSRRGSADDVEILEARGNDTLLWLHLKDAAIGDYWRAVTAIRGRLVSLSTSGFAERPLSPADGRRLLAAAVTAMQSANPAPQPSQDTAEVSPETP